MQDRKNGWQYAMMAVFMVGLALMMMVPVFAAPGDNITGKSLTVNGPGDGTRPGGPAGGPWGTMQIIDTSGLNAYYASIGNATHCTWEFHPGNDVNNGWSFGALSKDFGSDLEIMRKVGGDWKPIYDLMVDFDSGRVGINTVNPDPDAELTVVNDNWTYGRGAVLGQTDGGGTVGVGGTNDNLTSFGFVGGSYNQEGTDYGVGAFGQNILYGKSGSLGTPTCGVYGYDNLTNGYAGYFNGDVHVQGTLTSSGVKEFKIDHPLYPTTKYLVHASVESPNMMNIYNGSIVLDSKGEAVVQLPAYFEALNKDFQYQLTCIGSPAAVYVKKEIAGNSFTIAGDKPGVKVSWQVTGIRHDTWAEANPLQVEVEKFKDKASTVTAPGRQSAVGSGKKGWADWSRLPAMPQ